MPSSAVPSAVAPAVAPSAGVPLIGAVAPIAAPAQVNPIGSLLQAIGLVPGAIEEHKQNRLAQQIAQQKFQSQQEEIALKKQQIKLQIQDTQLKARNDFKNATIDAITRDPKLLNDIGYQERTAARYKQMGGDDLPMVPGPNGAMIIDPAFLNPKKSGTKMTGEDRTALAATAPGTARRDAAIQLGYDVDTFPQGFFDADLRTAKEKQDQANADRSFGLEKANSNEQRRAHDLEHKDRVSERNEQKNEVGVRTAIEKRGQDITIRGQNIQAGHDAALEAQARVTQQLELNRMDIEVANLNRQTEAFNLTKSKDVLGVLNGTANRLTGIRDRVQSQINGATKTLADYKANNQGVTYENMPPEMKALSDSLDPHKSGSLYSRLGQANNALYTANRAAHNAQASFVTQITGKPAAPTDAAPKPPTPPKWTPPPGARRGRDTQTGKTVYQVNGQVVDESGRPVR